MRIEALERRSLLTAATINWNDVRQTVDGFGASSAWNSSPIPSPAIDQIFSPTTGAGLSLLRTRIAPYGTSVETSIMQQMAPYGVRVWSTPWSPPREWKTNHDNNNGGSLDPAHYQDYANLLADYVQNMRAQGVPLYALSLQNEPDINVGYDSCIWTEQQFTAFLPFIGQTFATRGITAKLMLPENSNWSFDKANSILANPDLSQYVGIIAAHNYDRTFHPYVPVNGTLGLPLWETEVYFDSGPTQMDDAVTLADDIHDAFTVGGARAYNYWWLSSSSGSQLTTNWTPTKRLWSLGQYSRFVRPGWVMIGETDDGGLDVTTFKDPNSGKFAIVVANTSTTAAVTETYTLNGFSAAGVTPYVTSSAAGDDLKQYADISLTGGTTFSATIAANSVVTYVGVSTASPPLQAPGNSKASPQYGFQTSRIALSWSDNSGGESAYTVERSVDGTSWTVLTSSLAANATTFVDTGLAENTAYSYRVKATNGASASAYSGVASASTVLAAPSGMSSSAITGGLRASWTINSATSSGVTLDRSLDGLAWTNVATLATRATSYSDVIPGYNANQIYFYRVRNAAGANVSGYGTYNTALKAPTGFTAAQVLPNAVTFTWTNNAVGASGARIEQFNSASSTWTTVSPSGLLASPGTYTLTGLTEGTPYSFRLKVTAEAESISSAYATSIAPTTPVATPSDLTAISTAANTAQLTWTDNSAVETAYQVERSTDSSTWTVVTSSLAAGSTSYTDTSAPAGTVYYRVKAVAAAGSSTYARTQLVAAAPIITAAATVTGTTMSLSAAPPGGFGTGSLSYSWSLVGTPPAPVTFSVNGNAAAADTTATFAAAGAYVFRVTITDGAGNATTATKSVSVSQTLTSITVVDSAARAAYSGPAAPTPAIVKSTWQQLGATSFDQFGVALATQPTFTWSVLSGGGSVSTTGLYTAPSTAAAPIVRAASSSISGQITLNVLNSAQLIAAYGLNEGSGWNLADTTGSAGVTAKLSGGGSFVAGRMGQAIDFNGVDGSAWLGRSGSLDVRGQITLAAWVRPESLSATQVIVGRTYGDWPNQSGTFLSLRGGKYAVGYFNGGYHYASSTIPAGDVNTWVHLVGTYDGKTWRLYRNGVQVATLADATGAIYAPKSWRIGSSDASPSPSEYFNGRIDSVRLYGQALSATEVTSLYNQGIVLTAAAAATPPSVTGTSTSLSVAAVDPDTNADSLFTYTWSLTSGPAPVTFSGNGTNAAKNATASFTQSGTYALKVTVQDVGGLTTTSTVNVTVDLSPHVANNHLYVNFNGSPISLGVTSGNVTVASASIATQSFDPATFADILVSGTAGADTLSVTATLPRPMAFAAGGGGDSFNVGSAASYTFNGDASTSALAVTILGSATFAASQAFASLTINGTAHLTPGGSKVLTTSSLSVSGKFDLGDGSLVVHGGDAGSWNGSAYTGISGLLARGRHGGAWDGNGISTSMADAQPPAALTNLAVTTSGGDVQVRYVVDGDADANGRIDGDDYFLIDSHTVAGANSWGWFHGDFDYNGRIDGDDYFIIDRNIGRQGLAS